MTEQPSPPNYAALYFFVLRVAQPARIQDIIREAQATFSDLDEKQINLNFRVIHEKARSNGLVCPVRRGTYVLSEVGMEMAGKVTRKRKIDRTRLFLMKEQRKRYGGAARRLE